MKLYLMKLFNVANILKRIINHNFLIVESGDITTKSYFRNLI